MSEEIILPALVLNDYEGKHFATWVEEGIKTIETRTGRRFTHTGDLLICCGAKSVTANAGKALCVVNFGKVRKMQDEDEKAACIENHPKRYAHDLTELRKLSYKFKFTDYAVKKNYQGIFSVRIPSFVTY